MSRFDCGPKQSQSQTWTDCLHLEAAPVGVMPLATSASATTDGVTLTVCMHQADETLG